MRIVAALGGNALLERGEPPEAGIQEAHVVTAVGALAPLAAGHNLVITHGNGPQVGMLALESAHDPAIARPYPFDVLGAQTQGMIGYWLVQALQNALPGRQVACLVSRTLVRRDDPAFAHPSKFVGPVYDEEQARALAASQHWEIRQDGARWRRVVPSPEPAGPARPARHPDPARHRGHRGLRGRRRRARRGQGRPGPRRGSGGGQGPDRLAAGPRAGRGRAAAAHRRGRGPGRLRHPAGPADPPGHPAELRKRDFPAGSMGPKIEAVCRFTEATGKPAAIGRLADAEALLVRAGAGRSSSDMPLDGWNVMTGR